ncbi:MAG TPA: SDR family oxidoreductase [Acetobacteraceae bacterium]|nr:SDR family oxidoreductase [Acetobacteraceae bacterium]
MRLANKIGIVTAAGSGMGRAGALRFAREGAAVAVVDVSGDAANAVVRQITEAGGKAIALVGDLTSDDFARDIVRQTARQFGGLDFVWNHVGTPGPASIEGIDWKDFDFAMTLNVRTVLVTTEAALPELRARGGGALLFTASTSGLVGSPYSPVYNIAKFGVVGLVKGLAKRYGTEKIRVNAVCPGTTDTPMLRVFVARPDSQIPPGETPETLVVKRGGLNPMRRVAQPEEIANAALFLISDEASFVNGVALPVDGGATA